MTDEESLAALGRDNADDTARAAAGRCGVPGCAETAAVIVADTAGVELQVCRAHWQDMADASGGRIRAVRLA